MGSATLRPVNDTPRPRHDPLAALRERGFLLYTVARFASGIGGGVLQAALLWQVYLVSGSALQLGVLGLVRFLPQLVAALYAGAFADTHDRKRIVLVAQCVPALCSLALLLATVSETVSLPLIYGLVALMGLAGSFDGPARQALLPSLVSPANFQNAITVNSTLQSLTQVSGPALAGVLIKLGGVPAAYATTCALIVVSFSAVLALRPRPVTLPSRAITWAAIKEGVQFVRGRQALFGALTLDMFAIVFGGAQALLPVYATDILHVGELGYGILASSLSAGALLMSIVLVLVPRIERIGRAMMWSVGGFGIATIVFGASRSFPLSVAAYMAVGMADQISVLMRQTVIQIGTPDHLRGRVSAVNQVFVGTSNQLGAMESGFLAAATSATFAVVSGGFACLAVLAIVGAKMPGLRNATIHEVMKAREDNDLPEPARDAGAAGG